MEITVSLSYIARIGRSRNFLDLDDCIYTKKIADSIVYSYKGDSRTSMYAFSIALFILV